MKTTNHRFHVLDGLRGYFVLLTFFVHLVPAAAGYAGVFFKGKSLTHMNGKEIFYQWLCQSNYGVFGFFILSAFLIGRMIQSKNYKGHLHFFYHRFLRIYPAFFISIVISGLIGIFYTHYVKIGGFQILQNLFFLNGFFLIGEIPSLNFVTWSLFFETVFYLSVPLIFILQNRFAGRRKVLFSLFFVLIGLTALVLKLTSMYVLFYGGLVISQFSDEELKSFARRMKERWILAAYLITTTTYSLDLFTSQAFMYIFLVVCTCMIVKAAFDDQSFLHSIFSAQWLRSIGRVSYSFYLLHSVIIVSFFFFLEKNFTDVNKHNLAVLSLPIVLSATLIASTLLYRLVEQPYFHRKQKFAKPDVLSPIFAGERRVLDGTEPRAN